MRRTKNDQSAGSNTPGAQVQGGVAALERGLRILNAFDQRTPVLTLVGLALRTGLHKSTILRLAVSLEGLGYLDKDREGLYRIGAQVWRVALGFNAELHLQQVLPPILEELAATIGESCAFWVPVGTVPPSRVCVFRSEPQRSVRVHTPVGSQMPWDTGGAAARVMRAFADARHREDDGIRAEGVCATWAERDPELCGAAAPVFGSDRRFVGVLSISAPISRRDQNWLERLKPTVRSAAERITNKLRHYSVAVGNEHRGAASSEGRALAAEDDNHGIR